jgi:hypothetical protein
MQEQNAKSPSGRPSFEGCAEAGMALFKLHMNLFLNALVFGLAAGNKLCGAL